MGDSNKQICRLCLEITPPCESEPIERIKKEDFDISDYPVACSRCLETLQDCLDFKLHCVNTSMDVDFKIDINKEVLQSDLIINGSICQDNSRACWLCMSSIEAETFNCTNDWKDAVLLKDIFRSCLSKVDINVGHEPLLCKPCLNSMKKYYRFMKSCQDVEQRIEHFRQLSGRGTTGRVNLEDVLYFKDYNALGNNIVDDNATKCLKNEETTSIKCEEIDVKDELDKGAKTSDLHPSENCDSSGQDGLSEIERSVRDSLTKGKKHVCPKCPYATNRIYTLRRHMCSHSDNEVYKCTICSFITDSKFLLKVHRTSHRGPSKVLCCRECPYKTDHSANFAQHILKHKDKSEVEMHKCDLCPYESRYRSKTVRHCKLKHKVDIKMYKCKECSYTTSCNDSLVSHQLLHKTSEEITQHKCEKCEFQSKYKPSLARHMLTHEDPKVANKFKCEKCPYDAKEQSTLMRHMRIHSNKHR